MINTNLPQDPFVLYSYLNTKLRDQYSNLDALCEDMNLSKEEILDKLACMDFHYDALINQFR